MSLTGAADGKYGTLFVERGRHRLFEGRLTRNHENSQAKHVTEPGLWASGRSVRDERAKVDDGRLIAIRGNFSDQWHSESFAANPQAPRQGREDRLCAEEYSCRNITSDVEKALNDIGVLPKVRIDQEDREREKGTCDSSSLEKSRLACWGSIRGWHRRQPASRMAENVDCAMSVDSVPIDLLGNARESSRKNPPNRLKPVWRQQVTIVIEPQVQKLLSWRVLVMANCSLNDLLVHGT